MDKSTSQGDTVRRGGRTEELSVRIPSSWRHDLKIEGGHADPLRSCEKLRGLIVGVMRPSLAEIDITESTLVLNESPYSDDVRICGVKDEQIRTRLEGLITVVLKRRRYLVP